MSEAYNKPTDEQIASEVEREMAAIRAQVQVEHPEPEHEIVRAPVEPKPAAKGFLAEVWEGMKEGWKNGVEDPDKEWRKQARDYEAEQNRIHDYFSNSIGSPAALDRIHDWEGDNGRHY